MNSISAGVEAGAAGKQDWHGGLRIAIVMFTVLAAVMVVVMFKQLQRDYPHTGSFREGQIVSPVLAIELAGSRADIEEALHAGKPDGKQASEALKTNTKLDCFFIVCYTGALISLALLFTVDPQARPLRWMAVAIAVLAGVFDYAENYGIFRAIAEQGSGPARLTDDLARQISYPSLEKWTTLGITLLILAAAMWGSQLPGRRKRVDWLLGLAFLIGGVLLLTAIQDLPLFVVANSWFASVLLVAALRVGWTLIRAQGGGAAA